MIASRTAYAVSAVAILLLAACGDPGSGGGVADPTPDAAAAGAVCDPVAGDRLVVLTDDQNLQNADNIIPAVNAASGEDSNLIPLLDSVSEVLTTDLLIDLNRAVDIDRQTSSQVAEQFVADHALTAPDDALGAGQAIVVGAANFSESVTLAEIYAVVLNSAGYDAEVQTIGNRETYLPALISGQLTVIPEYAASLAEFLNTSANGADADPVASGDVTATVDELTGLGEAAGLIFGEVSTAQDQNAFAVTTAFAEQYDVDTLSELAAACGGGVVLAGPAECPERPFCQPGLEDVYGIQVGTFTAYDFGLIGDAVRAGEASVGLVLSSDGSLASS